MMAMGNVGMVITDLKARIGGTATPLVSRNGLVLFADVPAGVYTEPFAIMRATILGAATTVNAELNGAPPVRIIMEGKDSRMIIVGSGKKALLVAAVDRSTDVIKVLEEGCECAGLLNTN